jgi:branched-subunit amino acid transport protein
VNAFGILLLAGVAVFAVRSSLVHVVHRITLGPAVQRALVLTVPAGLAAAVAASLASRAGTIGVAQVLAVVVTLAVGRRHGMPVAMGAGMTVHLIGTLAV